MYEEFFTIFKEKFPELEVTGENYPPHPVFLYLAYTVSILRVISFIAILTGPQFLHGIGIQQLPAFYQWTQDNKVLFILVSSNEIKFWLCFRSLPVCWFSLSAISWNHNSCQLVLLKYH